MRLLSKTGDVGWCCVGGMLLGGSSFTIMELIAAERRARGCDYSLPSVLCTVATVLTYNVM